MNHRCKIVFRGTIKEGADREKVETFLAGLIKTNISDFRSQLAHQGFVTIKENLSDDEERKYMPLLEKTGGFFDVILEPYQDNSSQNEQPSSKSVDYTVNKPMVSNKMLANLFNLFAVLSLLGGLIICVGYWPKMPMPISIIWLVAGILEAVLFATFSNILLLLNQIEINTRKS